MSYFTAQHLVRRILAVLLLIQSVSILTASAFLFASVPNPDGMRAQLLTRMPLEYALQGAVTLIIAIYLWSQPWAKPAVDSKETPWSPVIPLRLVGFVTALIAALHHAALMLGSLLTRAFHPEERLVPIPNLMSPSNWIAFAASLLVLMLCVRLPYYGTYLFKRLAAYPRLEPDDE